MQSIVTSVYCVDDEHGFKQNILVIVLEVSLRKRRRLYFI